MRADLDRLLQRALKDEAEMTKASSRIEEVDRENMERFQWVLTEFDKQGDSLTRLFKHVQEIDELSSPVSIS